MILDRARVREIEDGDLLAFHGRTIFSWWIRVVTKQRVTHVGIAVWIRGRLYVLEAVEGRGVRIHPLDDYLRDRKLRVDWHELYATQYGVDVEKLLDEAFANVGKRYAPWWQFFRSWGVLTRWIAGLMEWALDCDDERFFCSEHVLWCLRRAGYTGEGYRDTATATPGDVCELPCFHRVGQLPSLVDSPPEE